MTDLELDAAVKIYARRRPFRSYLVEFVSGQEVLVDHPEGIALFHDLWPYRGPNLSQSLFPSSSVCRLLDYPPETQ